MNSSSLAFPRTRLSLIYVIAYLTMSGIGFFLAPETTLRLFFSTGNYDDTFIRACGATLIVLSVFVFQVFRYRLEILYRTIIFVRIFLLANWLWLYSLTHDPVFLGFLTVVGLGVILSISAYALDRKRAKR